MSEDRYIRHTTLKGFGPIGQQRLSDASVLVVGLGGLGIPLAQYLNAMGVGTLGLVERDLVELSNLQRQVLYTEEDLGRPKLEVVNDFLSRQNSNTKLITHNTFLNRDNALDILAGYDLIVDATDNFPGRYLINDACVILGKPFVYGALQGYEGQVSVFNYQGGPTYRCLFPQMPRPTEIPDCNKNGVLGILPGIVGNLQALEVVKVIAGLPGILAGKLLIYDGLNQSLQKISFPLKEDNLGIRVLQDSYGEAGCDILQEVDANSLHKLLESDAGIQIVDVRTPEEFESYHLPGSRNIPLSELAKHRNAIDGRSAVYFVCSSGKRSLAAQQWFQEQLPDVRTFNLKDGLQSYQAICL